MSEGAVFGVPTILLVLPGSGLDEARASSPGADLAETEVGGFPALRSSGDLCATYVDIGSDLLSVAGGADCGRQQEVIELVVSNLPA